MLGAWLLIVAIIIGFHQPHAHESCLVPDANLDKSDLCHVQIMQSRQGRRHQTTSLILGCGDSIDATAHSIFSIQGNASVFATSWKDENNPEIQYLKGSKVLQAESTIQLKDRVIYVSAVEVEVSPGPGCDFKKDNLLNSAS